MLTIFRAPGGTLMVIPCQAECPIGHLVIDNKYNNEWMNEWIFLLQFLVDQPVNKL